MHSAVVNRLADPLNINRCCPFQQPSCDQNVVHQLSEAVRAPRRGWFCASNPTRGDGVFSNIPTWKQEPHSVRRCHGSRRMRGGHLQYPLRISCFEKAECVFSGSAAMREAEMKRRRASEDSFKGFLARAQQKPEVWGLRYLVWVGDSRVQILRPARSLRVLPLLPSFHA